VASDLQSYLDRVRSSLGRGSQVENDVVRELQTHAEDRLADLERSGLSRDEALRVLLRRLSGPRSLAREFHEAHRRASWHDVFMATGAFLLTGALFATHLWVAPAAVVGVAALIVAVTLYGLWQGRPLWFYPWAGLALTLLSFCGYLAFVALEETAGPIADGRHEAILVLGFAGALLYVPLALLILASCIRVASRRDWLNASLMLTPTAPVVVWLAMLHQRGGIREGATAMSGPDAALAMTFLSMALAAAAFVRVQSRVAKLATLCVTAALVLFIASAAYDAQLTLSDLAGRALLLFGFLLSPVLLETLSADPQGRAAGD